MGHYILALVRLGGDTRMQREAAKLRRQVLRELAK